MSKPLFLKAADSAVAKMGAELLGGKGHGLATMIAEGLPVPPALIYPTTVCEDYQADPEATMALIAAELPAIKAYFTEVLGYMPLLSVRSGARVSMPGMMDTVLNVGLDNDTFQEWSKRLGDTCVYDSSCRLVEMFGNVVHGIPRNLFEGKDMAARVSIFERETSLEFPSTDGQILGSIKAVFESWNNDRAKVYRKMNNIPDSWGTAVTLQAMVFGNHGNDSATGVLFTRNPDNGEPVVTGEYLVNAQGEDVVAGTRTPDPLSEMAKWNPAVHDELMKIVGKLEKTRKDVQDVEFTVQSGKLYILQTRNAKRSARAAVRIAVDMADEKLVTVLQALKRVTAKQFDTAQQAVIDPAFDEEPTFTGIPACSGVVTGLVMKTAESAINCKVPCILVTQETTPDDIAGMAAAGAVLTMTGGATSHAAVVARSMDKPCVVGLSQSLSQFEEGETISIDGATGRVWRKAVPVIDGAADPNVSKFRHLLWTAAKCSSMGGWPGAALLRMPELPFLSVEEAVSEVRKAAKAGTKIIDVSGAFHNKHEETFFQPFKNPARVTQLVKALEAEFGGTDVDLRLLTNVETSMKTLPVADTLEALVMHDEGPMVWAGKTSPAVKKVLEWKLGAGVTLASLGVIVEGGYVEEGQLIEKYLGA